MKTKFDVECPSCGEKGIARVEQVTTGVHCPSCRTNFVPTVPTFRERLEANLNSAAIVFVFAVFCVALVLGWIPIGAALVLLVIGLLIAAVVQLTRIAQKK